MGRRLVAAFGLACWTLRANAEITVSSKTRSNEEVKCVSKPGMEAWGAYCELPDCWPTYEAYCDLVGGVPETTRPPAVECVSKPGMEEWGAYCELPDCWPTYEAYCEPVGGVPETTPPAEPTDPPAAETTKPTDPPAGGGDEILFETTITPRDIAFTSPWGITNYNGLSGYAAAERMHQDIAEAIRSGPPEFKKFCGTGDIEADRRECAAFFANVCKETGGMGIFEEVNGSSYCTHLGDGDEGLQAAGEEHPCCVGEDKETVCPDRANCPYGCKFHGRGAIQLTWNFNYGRFSEFYYGDAEKLLRNPETVDPTGPSGWAATLWFWMTSQDYGGACPPPTDFSSELPAGHQSCHDAMHDPNGGGFGQTIRIINGGYEACKKTGVKEGAIFRVQYFLNIAADWNVPANKGCAVADGECDVSGGSVYASSSEVIGNPQIAFKEDSVNCPSCGIPHCQKKTIATKWGICGSGAPDHCPEPLTDVIDFYCQKCATCESQVTPPWQA